MGDPPGIVFCQLGQCGPVLQAGACRAYAFGMVLIYHTPLSPAQQAVAGIDPVQPLAMADQVRFSELDPLNHVNNVAYMTWFERLRVRYSQDWGISNYRSGTDNPRIVIRSGQIHYRQEMRLDEDYVVTCACSGFRTNSYALTQQLWSAGSLRATFDCVMVLLTADGSGKHALPDALCDRFQQVDSANREE
jgi:acyl-CoA thioester hydrolase